MAQELLENVCMHSWNRGKNHNHGGFKLVKHKLNFLIVMVLAMVGGQARAILITPDDCVSNCATGTVTDTNELISFIEMMYGAEELYRSDIDVGDSKQFADSYSTAFSDSNASINLVAGKDSIECVECFLLVQDGIAEPPWYVFDITGWDGLTDINLNDFWPSPGDGIAHISILGGGQLALLTTASVSVNQAVPEPSLIALLGMGLLGMITFRQKNAG